MIYDVCVCCRYRYSASLPNKRPRALVNLQPVLCNRCPVSHGCESGLGKGGPSIPKTPRFEIGSLNPRSFDTLTPFWVRTHRNLWCDVHGKTIKK